MKQLTLGLSIVGIVALAAVGQAGSQAAADMGFHALPKGSEAPNFTAYTKDGKAVSLKDYRGKIVILDFWASWCGPCQVSMPGLEDIYRQIRSQGVVVLSLNTWDAKPDFLEWVNKNSGSRYDFEFVRDPAEGDHDAIPKHSIAKRLYKVIGIPTMYVIDPKGRISDSFIGSGNEAGLVKTLGSLGIPAKLPTKTNGS